MFNQQPLNRSAFNHGVASGEERHVTGATGIILQGRAKIGTIYTATGTASVVLQGLATPARARIRTGGTGMALAGTARATRLFYAVTATGIALDGSAVAHVHYSKMAGSTGIALQGRAKAGVHYCCMTGATGLRLTGRARSTRIMTVSNAATGIVFGGQVNASLRTLETFTISIPIAPGQTLIVDTANYIVTLGGENVIYAHSGDWPQIVRGSTAIEVQSNGQTHNECIYAEQWL